MAGGKLIASEQGGKSNRQHKVPCSDCPWRRDSIPGWLGGDTPEAWVHEAHSDNRVDCHVITNQQCVGLAIYRANVCKSPRDPEALRQSPNRDTVFASPVEFIDHHQIEEE